MPKLPTTVLLSVLTLASGSKFAATRTFAHPSTTRHNLSIHNLARYKTFSLYTLRGGADKIQPKGSFLVGTISDALHTIASRSGDGMGNVKEAFRLIDLEVLLCWAFLPHVVLRFVSDQIVNKTIRRKNPLQFDDTPYLKPISQLTCQVGQLSLLVYFGELFLVFLGGLGVPRLQDKPRMLASSAFSVWAARLLCNLKTHLIDEAFERYHPQNQGSLSSRKALYNRFLDAAVYLVVAILFLDYNHIDIGVALASLLTLGGVSSIVVGLALKEPVSEIIQGTSMLLSDKFSTGDTIRLSDGSTGQVQDMRWTDITMRGSDNSFVRIPHSELAKSRVVNLSRMPHSQVSQEIKLPNRGHAKIKQLLDDIQKEIREACPKLIDDSSEPFRVNWTDLDGSNAVISIESHYRIPRLGAEYWENRQNVLTAISRAMERYNA